MMNLNQIQRDVLDKLKDGDDSWYEKKQNNTKIKI